MSAVKRLTWTNTEGENKSHRKDESWEISEINQINLTREIFLLSPHIRYHQTTIFLEKDLFISSYFKHFDFPKTFFYFWNENKEWKYLLTFLAMFCLCATGSPSALSSLELSALLQGCQPGLQCVHVYTPHCTPVVPCCTLFIPTKIEIFFYQGQSYDMELFIIALRLRLFLPFNLGEKSKVVSLF